MWIALREIFLKAKLDRWNDHCDQKQKNTLNGAQSPSHWAQNRSIHCFPLCRCVVILYIGARSARCGGGPPHCHRSRSGRKRTAGVYNPGQRGGWDIQSNRKRPWGCYCSEQGERRCVTSSGSLKVFIIAEAEATRRWSANEEEKTSNVRCFQRLSEFAFGGCCKLIWVTFHYAAQTHFVVNRFTLPRLRKSN